QDFRNRRTGLTVGYNSAKRKLNDASSVEYELQRVRFTPDPTGRSTWIHIARGSYFLTSDLYVRMFFISAAPPHWVSGPTSSEPDPPEQEFRIVLDRNR
ncbi:MAG: hypothetical protein NUW22_07290, partial [Acidobacteria bacterium]|nr:hypothetical protein [Acidobacteriota bacterium]